MRYKYQDYYQYKEKLARHEKFLQLLLYSKKDKKFFLYKPKLKSIYGTVDQKKNYYKALRAKLRINKNNSEKQIAFITLTYSTKLYTPEEVIKRCKHDLQKWLKLIRVRVGKINYFWITELTKKNYVHFHIIMKEYIPAKIIKSCWHATTGSYIIHVKGVSRTVASRYITKYISDASKLSDQQCKFMYDNNFKRLYASSKGFFSKKTKPPKNYQLIGIVTCPYCVVQAETGTFAELEPIALSYIITLMEEDRYGYRWKWKPEEETN